MTGSDPQLARGLSLLEAGRFAEAERLLSALAKARPRDAAALQALAVAQSRMGRYTAALRTLERVRELAPDRTEPLLERAQILRVLGRFDEALRAADEACRRAPDDAACLATKAEILHMTGDVDGAWRVLEAVRTRGRLAGAAVVTFAEVARLRGEPEAAIEPLRKHLANPRLPDVNRRVGLFHLGATLDAAGRHDEAFEAIDEAQRVIPVRHDPAALSRAIDEMLRAWSAEVTADLPRARHASALPVLVVGMPRSGTSLVEQILASHPRAAGAGELGAIPRLAGELGGRHAGVPLVTDPRVLRQAVVERAARAYVRRLRETDRAAKRVVDKNPLNALHLGLASRVVPAARVIHCRRNAIDTCLSCYFQNFAGDLPWAHDLRSLGAFHRDCERVMEHWKGATGLPILEVRYEALVSEQERETRRVIEFLGLEWDEACLRFWESGRQAATASNAQVRRPMYRTSVERWRRYERHLGPLLEALGLDGPGSRS